MLIGVWGRARWVNLPEINQAIPEIWFERLNRRLGLPMWAGAIMFGLGPFALLGIPLLGVGASLGATVSDTFLFLLFTSLFELSMPSFIFYTGRYLRREMRNLLEYARTLEDPSAAGPESLDLSNFSSIRQTFIVYVILSAFTIPLFVIGGTGSLLENLEGEVPYFWSSWILATFFWTFGYSMYSIHRMGRLPLRLKPYAQDRTLGLKPFATASLNSTLIYFGVVTAIVVVVAAGGAIPLNLGLLFLGLYPVGLLLFFLPLRSLHGKMTEAKKETLARITPRYERAVEIASSGAKVDEITNEMVAVVEIRRDIQQIHTWPFDTGIIIRLAAIVFSLGAILLSAVIRDLLHF